MVWQRCAAQLTTLSGELRYEHQYQDFYTDAGGLSTSLRQNPILNLDLRGAIVSRRLLEYSLYSSFGINHTLSQTPYLTFTNTQLNWNAYNLTLSVLPYAKAKVDLSARDNLIDSKFDDQTVSSQGRLRQQEQRIGLSVDQVPELPTLAFTYTRNKTWAEIGAPSEQLSNQYGLSLSASGGPSSEVNLSSSLSDVAERYTNFHERLLTVNLSGSKRLDDRNLLSILSDYNRFTSYSNLTGSVGYTGLLSDRLRVNTGFSGLSYSNAFTVGRTGGFLEGVLYRLDPYFQLGESFNGYIGTTRAVTNLGTQSYYSNNWNASTTLQHNRQINRAIVSNSLTLGYLVQEYVTGYNTLNVNFANGVQFPLGAFALNGDYSFAYYRTRNNDDWDLIGNSAGIVAVGTLPENIRSNTTARFRDDHYTGEVSAFRNQRNLIGTQQFDGSFRSVIPVNLGLGGSVTWYFANIYGHTYSWHLTFSSQSFFVDRLYALYTYTRTFDPYYLRPVTNHDASMNYPWRALTFQLRGHYATFPVRVRDIWFSVSRFF
jgi:hypothetical protein